MRHHGCGFIKKKNRQIRVPVSRLLLKEKRLAIYQEWLIDTYILKVVPKYVRSVCHCLSFFTLTDVFGYLTYSLVGLIFRLNTP